MKKNLIESKETRGQSKKKTKKETEANISKYMLPENT